MFLLPQIVGLANATEMLILGKPVDGAEAARIGLATKVVVSEELEDAAVLLGRQLAAGPARAQAVLREGLRRGMGSTLDAEGAISAKRSGRSARNVSRSSVRIPTSSFA